MNYATMIPYTRHSLDQADVKAVAAALVSERLTQGPQLDAFEVEFAEAVEAPYAVAFSSGTAALHAAAHVAGVGPGQELLTSALTFVASANCGAYLGAQPTFADIDPDTWNVSTETIADAITSRTSAIVVVHFAGYPAPVHEIREAVSVPIIEDAAHALGAHTEHGPVGNCAHSDMCCFSFHPAKAITSAEGGMVTTRSREYAVRLRQFRNHGFVLSNGWYREQRELGFNYRLSDLHAALGRSQLKKLPRFIERRREIAGRYRVGLAGVVDMPPIHLGHAYHLFTIRHPRRQALYEGLRDRGITTQVHYTPVYLNPYYRDSHRYESCPNAEAYYAECLSLPCFPDLTDDQQDEVIEAVRDVLA